MTLAEIAASPADALALRLDRARDAFAHLHDAGSRETWDMADGVLTVQASDGVNRWTRLGPYDKKTKVASAEIDPDHKIHIDRNDLNNSYTAEANGKPARKVSNYWLFVTQWVSQALAWWAV